MNPAHKIGLVFFASLGTGQLQTPSGCHLSDSRPLKGAMAPVQLVLYFSSPVDWSRLQYSKQLMRSNQFDWYKECFEFQKISITFRTKTSQK